MGTSDRFDNLSIEEEILQLHDRGLSAVQIAEMLKVQDFQVQHVINTREEDQG